MKKILILAFTASVMLGACKKDKQEEELQPNVDCSQFYVNSSNAQFDSQGRIIAHTYDNKDTYVYHSDRIAVTYWPNLSATYTLDEKGRIVKQVYNGETVFYEYNNDGYLIKETQTNNGNTSTKIYTWESGNPVKIVKNRWDGYSEIQNITYGSDIINDKLVNIDLYINILSQGQLYQYFGKSWKNAPVKIETKSEGGNYPSESTTYYEYNKTIYGEITSYKYRENGWSSNYYMMRSNSCN